MNKPKAIGTAAETAVVRFLRDNGWPSAERRALTGSLDQGDVTGCPGICVEVKAGQAAKNASDRQIDEWLRETETERHNANAQVGILVTARAGLGPANVGRWWAHMPFDTARELASDAYYDTGPYRFPIRMTLDNAVTLLHAYGYGSDPWTEK